MNKEARIKKNRENNEETEMRIMNRKLNKEAKIKEKRIKKEKKRK